MWLHSVPQRLIQLLQCAGIKCCSLFLANVRKESENFNFKIMKGKEWCKLVEWTKNSKLK